MGAGKAESPIPVIDKGLKVKEGGLHRGCTAGLPGLQRVAALRGGGAANRKNPEPFGLRVPNAIRVVTPD